MSSLDITDLKSVLTILNVCTERGAFKANELENVGKTYNKIYSFVSNSLEKLNKENKENNMDTTEDNVTPVDKPHETSTGGHSMKFN